MCKICSEAFGYEDNKFEQWFELYVQGLEDGHDLIDLFHDDVNDNGHGEW